MSETLNEFELIQQIQRETSVSTAGVELGIGDDAAVLAIPVGQHLVAATDTLHAGIHFPVDTAPYDIGYKCLAVNLSDLAAMGATPHWALLALSFPQADTDWLRSFTAGFKSLAQSCSVALVGGDMTRGPLSVSLTALGTVERGRQLLRSGAQPGDLIVVSGTVGGAARILDLIQNDVAERKPPSFSQCPPDRPRLDRCLLDRPRPRLRLGRELVGYASACIDISDGLLADLGHLLKASGCAARLTTEALPTPAILDDLSVERRWSYQLAGGDDYELLFTLPVCHESLIESWRKKLDIRLSVVGKVEAGDGICCVNPHGAEFHPQKTGFDHFGEKC